MPRTSTVQVQIPLDVARAVYSLAESRSLHNPVTAGQQEALEHFKLCMNLHRHREDEE